VKWPAAMTPNKVGVGVFLPFTTFTKRMRPIARVPEDRPQQQGLPVYARALVTVETLSGLPVAVE